MRHKSVSATFRSPTRHIHNHVLGTLKALKVGVIPRNKAPFLFRFVSRQCKSDDNEYNDVWNHLDFLHGWHYKGGSMSSRDTWILRRYYVPKVYNYLIQQMGPVGRRVVGIPVQNSIEAANQSACDPLCNCTGSCRMAKSCAECIEKCLHGIATLGVNPNELCSTACNAFTQPECDKPVTSRPTETASLEPPPVVPTPPDAPDPSVPTPQSDPNFPPLYRNR